MPADPAPSQLAKVPTAHWQRGADALATALPWLSVTGPKTVCHSAGLGCDFLCPPEPDIGAQMATKSVVGLRGCTECI